MIHGTWADHPTFRPKKHFKGSATHHVPLIKALQTSIIQAHQELGVPQAGKRNGAWHCRPGR